MCLASSGAADWVKAGGFGGEFDEGSSLLGTGGCRGSVDLPGVRTAFGFVAAREFAGNDSRAQLSLG